MIDVGHMANENAWMKYLGQEYIRIAIDELPLFKSEASYFELISRLRTTFPELKCQIIASGNAGGPLSGFIEERFMKVVGKSKRTS